VPKFSPNQSSFSGGEYSPLVYGRTDMERYKDGLKTMKNAISTMQGGAIKRSGTYYVSEAKDSSDKVRLVEFEYSVDQAYVIEFGDLYCRFYKDNAVIESSPGVPYEIVSPYAIGDIYGIKYFQSADVLYLLKDDYKPRKLKRYSDTDWEFEEIVFIDGPYLGVRDLGAVQVYGTGMNNILKNALTGSNVTPSGTTGSITVTMQDAVGVASSANAAGLIRVTLTGSDIFDTGDKIRISGHTEASVNGDWVVTRITATTYDLVGSTYVANGINGNAALAPFVAADVGRSIRIRYTAAWGWGVVTAVNNGAQLQVLLKSDLSASTATALWRLGVYYIGNYPSCGTFHEDRLCLSGAPDFPQRIDASKTSDYEVFSPTDLDSSATVGTVNAWSFTLNATDVNATKNLVSDEKGLAAFTYGGEWVVRPSNFSEALSPTNVSAKKTSSYGSSDAQAIQMGRSALFVQKGGRKMREYSYFYDVDGFRATDLSVLAEHITGSGISEVTRQKEPQNILWCVRNDGVLLGCTYERDESALYAGWHRHILGGVSDTAGSAAIVESAVVIPSPDGTTEELWLSVKRYIDGGVVRYIEYMKRPFDDLTDQRDGFFVDCGLTYNVPKTITGIATGANTDVTSAAHGFSNGDEVFIDSVFGCEYVNGDGVDDSVNNKIYTISNVAANTFRLVGIDSTTWSAYISGGIVRKRVLTVSGLDHLEGQTVAVQVDGAAHPNLVVASGAITLQERAAIVHVGLPYECDIELLRVEGGSAHGTSIGKTRRVNRLMMMVHRTLGLKIGSKFTALDDVYFRYDNTPMGLVQPLFSGILSEEIDADYDLDGYICIRSGQPLPLTLLSVSQILTEYDR